jgi:hypothetical protein
VAYKDDVLALSPVQYLRHGEQAGTSALDASTNANTSTYTGGFTLVQPGIPGTGDYGVLLNGTTGYISVPGIAALDLADGPFTFLWWMKLTALTGAEQKIFDKTGANAYQIVQNGTGVISFGKAGVATIVTATTAIADTTAWHLCAASKTGATSKLYLDGADVTGAVTDQTLANSAGALIVGANRSTVADFLNGKLDEVSIFASVLTAQQVSDLYQAGIAAGYAYRPVTTRRQGRGRRVFRLGRTSRRWSDAVAASAATNATAEAATGTGVAQTPSISVAPVIPAATGTATAQAAAPSVKPSAGLASGTGTALGVTASLKPTAGVATGTGTAQAAHPSLAPTAGVAQGTGTAQAAAPSVKPTAGLATGTGTAQTPSISLAPTAAVAAGTGTAQAASAAIKVLAGLATGTATAYDATVSTGTGSNSPTAGVAAGTGSANQPSVAIAPSADLAQATATAQPAALSVKPTAGLATATTTAQPAASSVKPTAGVALGTGTAQVPAGKVGTSAPVAAGTATAHDATATTGSSGSASAGLAAAVAQAWGAHIAIGVRAGVAGASAMAHDAIVAERGWPGSVDAIVEGIRNEVDATAAVIAMSVSAAVQGTSGATAASSGSLAATAALRDQTGAQR